MSQLSASSEMATNTNQSNSQTGEDKGDYVARPPRNSRQQVAKQPMQQQRTEKQPLQQGNNRQEEIEQDTRISLAEIFAPESDESSDSDADDQPIDSIDGLSKRLKLKPEDVYKIKVPMRDGAEAVTIGDLKDRVGELVELETREAQFDQRRVKAEGEILRAQTEIRDILAMIPKEHVPAGIVDKIRKRHEAVMNNERELTLEHIPEWQDDKKYQADKAGMIEMLAEYGFDASFIETVVDHRAVKFIRDAYLRDKRIKEALKRVGTPLKNGKKPSGKAGKPAKSPGAYESKVNRNTGAFPDQRAKIKSIFGD